jgi:DNA-binding LacI/PurR family transcriptional regulator
MEQIPQRRSLVAEVADVVRRAIEAGEWSGVLPGQRALSEQLQVSRPILRQALLLLRREGYLQTAPGRSTQIIKPAKRKPAAPRSNIIGFLSPIPLENLSYQSLFIIVNLQQRLSDAGFRLEIHTEKRFQQRFPARSLEKLVRHTNAACWILHFTTPEIQRWFSDRQLPAIVSKTRHPHVRLPAIDLDYFAMGRHAGGRLVSYRHRRIGLIVGRQRSAGDLLFEKGLREALAGHDASLVLVHYDDMERTLPKTLANQLTSERPPTVFATTSNAAALMTLGHLREMGRRVPDDVSVLCATDEPLLRYHVPGIARYTVNPAAYARRICRLALQTARARVSKPVEVRVMTDFVPAASLGPARG